MIGSDSLLIDPKNPECQEFMTSLYEGRLKIECPFSTVRFENDIYGVDLRNVISTVRFENDIYGVDLRNVIFLMDHLNLTLKIPKCMHRIDSLVIDTAIPECQQWAQFLMQSESTKVDCPFTTARIGRVNINDADEDLNVISFLIEHLNLSLKIPRVMHGTDAW